MLLFVREPLFYIMKFHLLFQIHLNRRSICSQFSSNVEHAKLDSLSIKNKCSKCSHAYHNFIEKVSEGHNFEDKEVCVNGDAQALQKQNRTENGDKMRSKVRLIIEETNSDPST